jgi:hypothetical protein
VTLVHDVFKPDLRVFLRLDVDRLSNEFIEVIGDKEGNFEYVDADLGRDYEYTEEIMQTTIGAAIVDDQGNILREYEGDGAVDKARRAVSGAKVTLGLDIDEPVAQPADDYADNPYAALV